ncbi:hypothetical protein ACQEVF_45345 [Nonomuraea polychroma]|uniref:hypothetical protein n=1 Tax=Nonomuraea polychroma TaxID=46176 RepID=UPI003D8FF0C5
MFHGPVQQELLDLDARVLPHLAVADLPALLADGHLIMASVHKEIRCPHQAAPGRGGHLVVLTGQVD